MDVLTSDPCDCLYSVLWKQESPLLRAGPSASAFHRTSSLFMANSLISVWKWRNASKWIYLEGVCVRANINAFRCSETCCSFLQTTSTCLARLGKYNFHRIWTRPESIFAENCHHFALICRWKRICEISKFSRAVESRHSCASACPHLHTVFLKPDCRATSSFTHGVHSPTPSTASSLPASNQHWPGGRAFWQASVPPRPHTHTQTHTHPDTHTLFTLCFIVCV